MNGNIIKNYDLLKNKFQNNERLSNIELIEPQDDMLDEIYEHLSRGVDPAWNDICRHDFVGHLTYIHEKKEVLLKPKYGFKEPVKDIPKSNRRHYNHTCHYPAMLEEAMLLKNISDNFKYNFTIEELAYYNYSIINLEMDNQIIIEQIGITINNTNANAIFNFFERLSLELNEDVIRYIPL